ncbi:pantetheine-phosphate adenylyltransferase [bacterium TMED181]|nr:pantetheine-phosphate adenylyltransferase [Planctomycetota bacterium]OUW45407.1 MAG: pantetheine-phosphate adenylyltransferase [bacterium TMED181]
MSKAVYPGTFDPPHQGHLDLIERGSRMFDELIVAVAVNRQKSSLFTPEERVQWLQTCVEGIPGVRVQSFDGLVVDLLQSESMRILLRGIRTFADFEAEYTMALTNRSISGSVEAETVFVLPSLEFSHLSSRHIKEIAAFGGDIRDSLPDPVADEIAEELNRRLLPGSLEN